MSISTLDKVHFWLYLLNHNSLSHQTWPIYRYKQGQQFSAIFWTIWKTRAKFQVLFNFSHLLQLLNNQLSQDFKVSIFGKVNKRHFKNGNCQLFTMARFHNIVILIKSLMGLELVSSLYHWAQNMLEIFVKQHISI